MQSRHLHLPSQEARGFTSAAAFAVSLRTVLHISLAGHASTFWMVYVRHDLAESPMVKTILVMKTAWFALALLRNSTTNCIYSGDPIWPRRDLYRLTWALSTVATTVTKNCASVS